MGASHSRSATKRNHYMWIRMVDPLQEFNILMELIIAAFVCYCIVVILAQLLVGVINIFKGEQK